MKDKCPECGKPGEKRKYKDGDIMYIHERKHGLFGFGEITKHCYIPKGK